MLNAAPERLVLRTGHGAEQRPWISQARSALGGSSLEGIGLATFRRKIRVALGAGASTAAVARRHEIHPTLLRKWRKQLRQDPERAFRGNRNGRDEEARSGELERMVGRLTMEHELLKKALARLEEQRPPSVAPTSRR